MKESFFLTKGVKMKNIIFLLPLFFSVSCAAQVEETHPPQRYCEVEYVEGFDGPDKVWYEDVVLCTRVANYRRTYSTVYYFPFYGKFRRSWRYRRQIARPRRNRRGHKIRAHHHHRPRLTRPR